MPTKTPQPHFEAPIRAPAGVVSIVLVYNNFEDTDECVRSLLAQDHPRHRILIVDNGSSDGCMARLRQAWGGNADFYETGENLGVAGGYNAGIRAALTGDADYVVLCNNDIVAEPGFVSGLLGVFAAHPRTAIAVPVMLYYDRPDRVWFGRVTQIHALAVSRNDFRGAAWRDMRAFAGRIFESAYVTTCASMVSRAALEEVGLLDERFFFGHDDVDWSLRARARGYSCNVLGRPLVKHKVSVTSGVRGSNELTPRSAYTHATGSVLIGAKHYRNWAAPGFLVGLLVIRVPVNVLLLVAAGRAASVPKYLRGIVEGLLRHGHEFMAPASPPT